MSLIGFININKPAGITSHDVIFRLRKWTKIQRIGHAGTLDPAATGVLPVAIGTASRLIPYLSNEKIYLAEILLGTRTTTDDLCGAIVQQQSVTNSISEFEIESVLNTFTGQLEQKPPIYSAIKKNGQRSYDWARKKLEKPTIQCDQSQTAETVDNMLTHVAPRQVDIKKIELLQIQLPVIKIRISCSSGTYIRSLARDIGQMIGVGGCLKSLHREQSGVFTIENAVELNMIEALAEAGELQTIVLAPGAVLQTSIAYVDRAAAKAIAQGGFLSLETICPDLATDLADNHILNHYCLVVYRDSASPDQTIALCKITEYKLIKPKVVLVSESFFE